MDTQITNIQLREVGRSLDTDKRHKSHVNHVAIRSNNDSHSIGSHQKLLRSSSLVPEHKGSQNHLPSKFDIIIHKKEVEGDVQESLQSQYDHSDSNIEESYFEESSIDKKRLKNEITSSKEIERQLEIIPLQKLYNIIASHDSRFKKINYKRRSKELELFRKRASPQELNSLIKGTICYDIFKANILKRSDDK